MSHQQSIEAMLRKQHEEEIVNGSAKTIMNAFIEDWDPEMTKTAQLEIEMS